MNASALAAVLLCAGFLAPQGRAAPRAGAPAAKRRPLAGLVVRSKDWVVHRGTDTVEEWTGDVSYRRQGREIWADWAQRRHVDDRWLARGRVRAVWTAEDGAVTQARGDEARYGGEAESGTLLPKPGDFLDLERREPDRLEPARARARKMTWDAQGRRARLEGDVYAWGPEGKAWAGAADIDDDAKRLDLSGRRPVLLYDARECPRRVGRDTDASKAPPKCKRFNGAVQADRIAAFKSPRSIEGEGAVRGWVVFERRPSKP